MAALDERHVVTCFLRAEGEVLLLRRSGEVGSYGGAWGAVAGHAEGYPDAAARREIEEETGFRDADLVRRGEPFPVEDEDLGVRWIVHPYLFDVPRREPSLNYESTTCDWASPTEILRRKTVPDLWRSYRSVAPTLDAIRDDRAHGSTYLSLRALEMVRDIAAEHASRSTLRRLARDLISSRPSMAAVRNRISRGMTRCSGKGEMLEAADCLHGVLREAVEADRRASREAAKVIEGTTVLTLSRSGTVMDALLAAGPRVIVAISEPGREGISVGKALVEHGLDVTLVPDAGLASAPAFDLVLLGCDTVLPDGTLLNKIGSRLAALVARERQVPVFAATSIDKLQVEGEPASHELDRGDIGDVPPGVHVHAHLFEPVSPDLVDAYLTERGRLAPNEMSAVADDFRQMGTW